MIVWLDRYFFKMTYNVKHKITKLVLSQFWTEWNSGYVRNLSYISHGISTRLSQTYGPSLYVFIITGEEVLHEGWSSYDNLFSGSCDNCHGVRRKNICIYYKNTRQKWLFSSFKNEF
jgi:hypothetical protein